jgi:1-acyl-sn-glycerol-3-phosphate acyltransferase
VSGTAAGADPHRRPAAGERRHFAPPWPEDTRRSLSPLASAAGDLRALGRLLAAALWVCVLLLRYLPAASCLPAGARARARAALRRTGCRELLLLAGVRVRVAGPLPRGGCLVVLNHLSWLDPLIVSCLLGPVFVALDRPVVGPIMAAAGAVLIGRGRAADLPAAIRRVAATLQDGGIAGFYPEGTTSFGNGLLPLRAPLFEAAVRARAPVACGVHLYATPLPWPGPERSVAWVDWTPLPVHVFRVLRLPSVTAVVRFAPQLPPPRDRKSAARDARAVLLGLLSRPPAPR